MSHLDAAVRQQQYELAALRLVLGVVNALDGAAPAAREELLTLLSFDAPATARRAGGRASGSGRRSEPRRRERR